MQWLLHPSSQQGVAMRGDWYVLMVVGAAVGAYVYAAIIWCLIAYRRRPGRAPATFSGNTPLEIVYVALPLAIVIVLFAFTMAVERPVDRVSAEPQNVVTVTAYRWSWRFAYQRGGVTVAGTPQQPPVLYLPLDSETEIRLMSADVTHSFWIPAFLFKRDAIPGMTNVFDLRPTRLGAFPARCAQFCGLDHALMTFTAKVVSRAAFERYLATHGKALP
jgi:cytochrome c oxidase subunit 2